MLNLDNDYELSQNIYILDKIYVIPLSYDVYSNMPNIYNYIIEKLIYYDDAANCSKIIIENNILRYFIFDQQIIKVIKIINIIIVADNFYKNIPSNKINKIKINNFYNKLILNTGSILLNLEIYSYNNNALISVKNTSKILILEDDFGNYNFSNYKKLYTVHHLPQNIILTDIFPRNLKSQYIFDNKSVYTYVYIIAICIIIEILYSIIIKY
jgi:hypothetical protein